VAIAQPLRLFIIAGQGLACKLLSIKELGHRPARHGVGGLIDEAGAATA
jgi:hypothetical protein